MEECLEPIITGRLLFFALVTLFIHISLYMTAPPFPTSLSTHITYTCFVTPPNSLYPPPPIPPSFPFSRPWNQTLTPGPTAENGLYSSIRACYIAGAHVHRCSSVDPHRSPGVINHALPTIKSFINSNVHRKHPPTLQDYPRHQCQYFQIIFIILSVANISSSFNDPL